MQSRIERLQDVLGKHDFDAFLVAEPANRTYMSGFTGSFGYAVVTQSSALFFTDFRYIGQATEQCEGFSIVQVSNQGNSFLELIGQQLQASGVKTLGFEQDYLTYGDALRFRQLEQIAGVELVATSGVVESLRKIKDAKEVEYLQSAAKIADATFEHIVTFLRPGLTELDVALEMEIFMRKQGAKCSAFDTIVASGWRSSLPHGVASSKVIEVGDLVKFDFGARYQGYISDLTRTVVMGKPTEKQTEIYHIVLQAQLRSLDAIQIGMEGRQLDAVARDFISEKGYGDKFGHSLGHGIGLAVHEGPRVSMQSGELLEAGMVITIEPGIYLPEWGGVRIEDDVLIEDGGKRILTSAPKLELISIG